LKKQQKTSQRVNNMDKIKALPGKILAEMIDKPDGFRRTKGGIILKDADQDTSGIRPRWFKVFALGEDIDWLTEGQYLLVDHGRWSTGVKLSEDTKLYLIDNNDCLVVSDENPMEKAV
jgi:hypothetical protein